MLQRIKTTELIQALLILLGAIGLQIVVWNLNDRLVLSPQFIIVAELVMAFVIALSANLRTLRDRGIHHAAALILISLITIANITSLVLVLFALTSGSTDIQGTDLLTSAIAIFLTNIIVYALLYWEIDSPGLTSTRWSSHNKDFQFTQQDMKGEFPDWEPQFLDYFYLSVTNAVNFAPADVRPLTHSAKLLMGSQSLISVFTLALVIARSVSILG